MPEFSLTFINIFIFVFIYFYFDLLFGCRDQLAAGLIAETAYRNFLKIDRFTRRFREFLEDPAHIYVILGGALLGT